MNKTITMDYSEYSSLLEEKNALLAEVNKIHRAIGIVYGREVSQNILLNAKKIEESKSLMRLKREVYEGKI